MFFFKSSLSIKYWIQLEVYDILNLVKTLGLKKTKYLWKRILEGVHFQLITIKVNFSSSQVRLNLI